MQKYSQECKSKWRLGRTPPVSPFPPSDVWTLALYPTIKMLRVIYSSQRPWDIQCVGKGINEVGAHSHNVCVDHTYGNGHQHVRDSRNRVQDIVNHSLTTQNRNAQ